MDSVEARKLALRDQLVTGRNRRSLVEVSEGARAIAEHLLASPEVRRAATVATRTPMWCSIDSFNVAERSRGRRAISCSVDRSTAVAANTRRT